MFKGFSGNKVKNPCSEIYDRNYQALCEQITALAKIKDADLNDFIERLTSNNRHEQSKKEIENENRQDYENTISNVFADEEDYTEWSSQGQDPERNIKNRLKKAFFGLKTEERSGLTAESINKLVIEMVNDLMNPNFLINTIGYMSTNTGLTYKQSVDSYKLALLFAGLAYKNRSFKLSKFLMLSTTSNVKLFLLRKNRIKVVDGSQVAGNIDDKIHAFTVNEFEWYWKNHFNNEGYICIFDTVCLTANCSPLFDLYTFITNKKIGDEYVKELHFVVSVRGTANKQDALIDVKFKTNHLQLFTELDKEILYGFPMELKNIKNIDDLQIHKGFNNYYIQIVDALFSKIDLIYNLIKYRVENLNKHMHFCGHSLGAALSTLCALKSRIIYDIDTYKFKVSNIMFGCPKIGVSGKFMELFYHPKLYINNFRRIYNVHDLVAVNVAQNVLKAMVNKIKSSKDHSIEKNDVEKYIHIDQYFKFKFNYDPIFKNMLYCKSRGGTRVKALTSKWNRLNTYVNDHFNSQTKVDNLILNLLNLTLYKNINWKFNDEILTKESQLKSKQNNNLFFDYNFNFDLIHFETNDKTIYLTEFSKNLFTKNNYIVQIESVGTRYNTIEFITFILSNLNIEEEQKIFNPESMHEFAINIYSTLKSFKKTEPSNYENLLVEFYIITLDNWLLKLILLEMVHQVIQILPGSYKSVLSFNTSNNPLSAHSNYRFVPENIEKIEVRDKLNKMNYHDFIENTITTQLEDETSNEDSLIMANDSIDDKLLSDIEAKQTALSVFSTITTEVISV